MPDQIARARTIIHDRLAANPANHFYAYAAGEMSRVDARLAGGTKPDMAFYESLTRGIGLMCARELEQADPPFCDAIYAMLGDIRERVLAQPKARDIRVRRRQDLQRCEVTGASREADGVARAIAHDGTFGLIVVSARQFWRSCFPTVRICTTAA